MAKNKNSKKLPLNNYLMKHFMIAVVVAFVATFGISLYYMLQQIPENWNFSGYYLYLVSQILVPLFALLAAHIILPAKYNDRKFWLLITAFIGFLIFITVDTISRQFILYNLFMFEGDNWIMYEFINVSIALLPASVYYVYLFKLQKKSIR